MVMDSIKYTQNRIRSGELCAETALFSQDVVEKIYAFHSSMGDEYNETPLVSLPCFAARIGVSKYFVKDECKRGGLKAFKLLGGAYAVANCLCEKLDVRLEDVDFAYLQSKEVKQQLGDIVFAAASDGNHGKAVAWAANVFNQRAVVYMPKGTAKDRIDAIEQFGGTVVVSEYTYDWCVSEVGRLADEMGWDVVPDTASDGDEKVATWVMQGYATMAREAISQLGGAVPTHMFLQAGVGSMAAAMTAVFANHYGRRCPKIYTLEPHQAACFYASGLRDDGNAAIVEGDMDSIMAGLSCGVPNPIAWRILKNFANGFFSCSDVLTANGMRILGNPLNGDERIISGESGAIGTGFIEHVTKNQPDIAKQIGLDENSVVLVFSTEGDTDTQNYRDVVWYGKYPLK